ncbi:MAG: putative rane-associated zinc metalloprotease [Deltaproteobacteria bacterium]|nr:putative rane-associated zinc metalloprotease [Deltaproteobacteria bacterium]
MPDIPRFLHQLSVYAIPVILAITFHEAAHGWVAYKKGDPTAKMLGRVTLNPLTHIDPFGTILLPAVMLLLGTGVVFGWARPVPVNFRLLRDQKRDPIYVASAGVVTNLALAAFSGILFRVITAIDPALLVEAMTQGAAPLTETPLRAVLVPLTLMCMVSVQFNVLLAFFNLIPVPPLDGGRIAVGLLPPRPSMALASVERYGMLIVILLLMFGPLGIIWRFIDTVSRFILGG